MMLPMRQGSFPIGLTFSLLACFLIGCSGESLPELAKVTGVVTLNGQPLEHIAVTFAPEADGAASSGTTDAEGRYTLMYNQHAKGAVLGQHRVMFQLADADATSNPIPAKYQRPEEQPVVTVTTEGPNEFSFEFSE